MRQEESALELVRSRFDNLYNRRDAIAHGVIMRAMDARYGSGAPDVGDLAPISEFLERFTDVVESEDAALLDALDDMNAALETLSADARRLAIDIMRFFAADADLERLALGELQGRVSLTGYAIIAVFAAIITILVLQRLRQNATEAKLREANRMFVASEADAKRARAQLQAAVEAMQDGFVLFDAEERLILANAQYRSLFPSAADVIRPGVTFEALLDALIRTNAFDDAQGTDGSWKATRLEQFRRANSISEQRLRSGQIIRYYEKATPDGGRVGVRMDITELHEARVRSEAANRAKSAFLANMSHEIRTPMNGILGMAEILRQTPMSSSQREMVETICGSCDALLSIINDILDLARIEAGKLALDVKPFVPMALMRRLRRLHGVTADRKGIELEFTTDARTTLPHLGDPVRFSQIVNNLVGNALKFTMEGKVSVALEHGAGGRVALRVRDTGIGMSPEQISRVFNEFEQADNSITREFGGSGLGLSITRNLVNLMGGQIEISSTPAKGTLVEVQIDLPVCQGQSATVADRDRIDVTRLRGLSVLVAEDNTTNATILRAMLRDLGVEARFVQNGKMACAAWSEAAFDMVLLDISMPVMGGVEALQRIREIAARQGCAAPVAIAVTANVMDDQLSVYRQAGFAAILGKPYRKAELAAALLARTPSSAAHRGRADALTVPRRPRIRSARAGSLKASDDGKHCGSRKGQPDQKTLPGSAGCPEQHPADARR